MKVLQNEAQIKTARAELVRRGISTLDSKGRRLLRRLLRRLGLDSSPNIGDEVKSWDVLSTVELIEKQLPKDAAILDIGAFASEVLLALHRSGYTRLSGVDLNPGLKSSPHADVIRYEVSDFTATPFPNRSFDAITAISVIEHGFNSQRLLAEVARLLRPGGYFIASFDYWPAKIDTGGKQFFNLDWLIFSEGDIAKLVGEAREHGLVPAGPIEPHASDRPIKCAGEEYTFGWLVLRAAG
jgi:SAM-dependent methyltransferase